ncbi:MAG: alcohol dehydrogenase class IV [Chlamydiales bacterium]|jgi:alcohol dehydrogenase class IV
MEMSIATHSTYSYNFPTHIRFGEGVVRELGFHLKSQEKYSVLLVTDPLCSTLPFFQEVVQTLDSEGISVEVYDKIHKNPLAGDVEIGAKQFRSTARDCIVGIGGGASLDVARSITLMAHHRGHILDYEECKGGEEKVVDEIPYFICIPTTSGTGSEVGRSAVISDDKTHEKKIIFSPRLLAKAVFADPLLTMDLPPHITAATGMDALTHNIEAYLSKGFHPICDGIALEGVRLVWNNIEEATLRPTLESRSNMLIASLMGGVAFQKGLGVVHSTAHPLSAMHDIHHGLANAVMLPYGMRFNAEVCEERLEILSALLKSDDIIESILKLNISLKLPDNLTDLGVKKEDLRELSEMAFADGCHACNPKPVSKEDFYKLYEDAL